MPQAIHTAARCPTAHGSTIRIRRIRRIRHFHKQRQCHRVQAGGVAAQTGRIIVGQAHPGVDGPGVGLVNGKLDAVFIGGLDPSSTTARFTVVDWKTGRRPTKPDDITRKLAQLDMYRLLLAAVEGVELDSIDATLYYVSEPDEGLRELHARAKTKQEILTELSSGIPEQSDND